MNSNIIERHEIKLSESHSKMIISGWGKEAYENSIVERITYLSDLSDEQAGGLIIKGYIAYPKDKSKEYPCVIWCRGGIGNNGAIDTFTARGIYGQLASWGYCVFASQYRGNAGSEGHDEVGGSDVNDIINLIPLADEIPQADKNLWGIEGWSRGGMMTFLTLQRNPNFKCAVLVGAISNVVEYASSNSNLKSYYENLIGKERLEKELNKRSAINFVNELPKIPYLLIHGAEDETVSPIQSIELANKFHEYDIPHKLVLPQNGDHFLRKNRKEVDELRREWYAKHLK
jgi:dipeptidyl aminopeptidase/acylaminoacyl peptidase